MVWSDVLIYFINPLSNVINQESNYGKAIKSEKINHDKTLPLELYNV